MITTRKTAVFTDQARGVAAQEVAEEWEAAADDGKVGFDVAATQLECVVVTGVRNLHPQVWSTNIVSWVRGIKKGDQSD